MDFHKYWGTTTQKVDTLLLVPPPNPISVYIRATCPSVDSSKWELPKLNRQKESRAANLQVSRPNVAESHVFLVQSLFLCCFQSSHFSGQLSDKEMMDHNGATEGLLMNLPQDPIEAAVLAVLPLLLEPAHQAAPRVRSAALSPTLGQSHMET